MPRARKAAARFPYRILIVDDHPPVREALKYRVLKVPDLRVCGEAGDTEEAMRLLGLESPDVAVVDIALHGGDGIDLIRRMKALSQDLRVVVWSMYGEDLYAERALRAGAQGYVTKDQATQALVDAIRRVMGGGLSMSPGLAGRLADQATAETAVPSPTQLLSDREMSVFRMMGEGKKARQMATEMDLSPKTVETYRDRVRQKLGKKSTADLLRYAVMWNLHRE